MVIIFMIVAYTRICISYLKKKFFRRINTKDETHECKPKSIYVILCESF